ncbi:MAG: hypothetical protein NW224_22020 [Leptolyngbyaceae cyanobacterium bins.302]|nr:hypothetical protein [Leptolyngbyaceae cyanobacterium bins.302]
MDYSLLSRLEGCLWGLAIGEQFGRATPAANALLPKTASHRRHLATASDTDLTWSQFSLQALQVMARSQPDSLAPTIVGDLGKFPPHSLNPATLAIATLPIALYYHDDLNRQRHSLWQVLDRIAVTSASRDWVAVFAYAIAQAVKGQLHPQLFMSQVLAYYRVALVNGESSQAAIVLEQLKQVETCQVEFASLSTIRATLGQAEEPAIAIALICFLQAPEDMQVALARCIRSSQIHASPNHAPWLCALVGALVGAYASTVSIPPAWKSSSLAAGSARGVWQQIPATAEILYASWAGLYEPAAIVSPLAVVAPWVRRGG